MKKIRLNDYADYESGKSSNGGCYGFWTDYRELENGNYEVSYGTTADFEYCHCCGRFGRCSCTDDDYEQITKSELDNILKNFIEDEDHWIEEIDC